jgi:hypothetical protein
MSWLPDPWRGLARTSDPASSHEAASRVVESGQQRCHVAIIIETVRRAPGRTSAELAIICGLERHEAARRTSDAEQAGAIQKGDPAICTVSGKRAVTWWASSRLSSP